MQRSCERLCTAAAAMRAGWRELLLQGAGWASERVRELLSRVGAWAGERAGGAGALLARDRARAQAWWSGVDLPRLRRRALLALAMLGSGLVVAAELSTLREVRVLTVTLERVSGAGAHWFALGALALMALPLAWGGAVARSRPATVGLCGLGALVLAVALAIDLPQALGSGDLGRNYADAGGSPGRGLYLELAGGALLVLTGAGLWRSAGRDAGAP
jgi:hypothetical protein